MCFKFYFWKLCNAMAVETSSQQETQQNEKWEQGLTSPQKAEAQAVFAMCFEILGVRYYLRCKVFLFKTNKTHWLLWWLSCRHFHSKQKMEVSFSPARAGPAGPPHLRQLQRSSLTCCDHLLPRTAKSRSAPVLSQLSLEVKEKLKIVSSRHKIKIFTGRNLVESLRREWIMYLNT